MTHFLNVSHEQMAIKAMLDGNVRLLRAVEEATEIDLRTLQTFESFADQHMGQSLYVLHEVAQRGYAPMLEFLVLSRQFDTDIIATRQRVAEAKRLEAEQIEAARKKRLQDGTATEADKLRSRIVIESTYEELSLRNPYGSASLLEYLEECISAVRGKLAAIAKNKRSNTIRIRKAEGKIANRRINVERYDAYCERMEAYDNARYRIALAPKKPNIKKPRVVPLYEAEKQRRWAVENEERLNADRAEKIKHKAALIDCRSFLLKYAAETAPMVA